MDAAGESIGSATTQNTTASASRRSCRKVSKSCPFEVKSRSSHREKPWENPSLACVAPYCQVAVLDSTTLRLVLASQPGGLGGGLGGLGWSSWLAAAPNMASKHKSRTALSNRMPKNRSSCAVHWRLTMRCQYSSDASPKRCQRVALQIAQTRAFVGLCKCWL
eukprot:365976-Chlamydomonas_euryale.AAC.14